MYGEEKALYHQSMAGQPVGMAKPVTIREQLGGEIRHMEEMLAKKKEMLALLDQNEAIEKFINLSRY